MKNYIGLAAALAVVGIFFYGQNLNLPLPLIDKFRLNFAPVDPVAVAAWNTFDQYRTYAAEGNLEGVKGLSHQVSETCLNPATLAECSQLMASVAEFARDLRQEDFQSVYYDGRQIVLVSDPVATIDGSGMFQVILFFTRTPDGEPKVLGMQFCFKGRGGESKSCLDAKEAARDEDNNGWWDAVESLFYK